MPEHPVQQHGIRAGVVLVFIAALAVTILFVAAAMHVLASRWDTRMEGANAPMDVRIPAPTLESAPKYERDRHDAGKDALLQSYAWIDREKRIARIPIDDAMRIMAGEPLVPKAPAADEKNDSPRGFAPQSSQTAGKLLAAAEVEPRPGALLPLDAIVTDDSGVRQSVAHYFGRSPVVLVFGYYHCRALCTTMMEGVLQALSATRLDGAAYNVLGVSIDPRDTAQDAADKARLYRTAYEGLPLHLLTASASEGERLSAAAGVRYAYDESSTQYAHPLALIVAAADGRIARYFSGVQFDPRDLRLALVETSRGEIGTLSDRIFLRCAHFDPQTGRYSFAALTFVRAGVVLVVLTLLGWTLRRRVRQSRR